ncbi:ATP synthase F1 subunit epsilon [Mycoplasma nasistruthionis]|uniref:ATP synthase epsilon chain n=1 Tax=Mycoplasma nasistruthionis TaxID=353852 RepID=A0A5B7XUV5_9MOLU|nr:ATP synthase F1 subunit epsilon [Mycoplasma nasistruthionis]QCZ36668.1 ATP synthase F1 subunit epsilon [Mycoplasma nasistruthionis]
MQTIHLTVTTPQQIFYEGDVEIVTLKTAIGYIGLQANRTPMFSNIEVGHLVIGWEKDDSSIKCYIGGGLVYADAEKINIITDDIIDVKNIDLQRALKEKEILSKEIEKAAHNQQVDRLKLETKLKKALLRIETYNTYNK